MNDIQKYLYTNTLKKERAWAIFVHVVAAVLIGLSVWLSAKRNDLLLEIDQLRLDKMELIARFERHGDEHRLQRESSIQSYTCHE